jgi:Fe-S-cluster-containing dehydrogenase component
MYYDGYDDGRVVKETLEKTQLLRDIGFCSGCSSCSVVCRRGLDMKAQIKLAAEIIVRS